MKEFDWQLAAFVGASVVQEMLHFRLPQIQYWNGMRDYEKRRRDQPPRDPNKDDDDRHIAA
ncbi:hypothetical protein [Gorillibacterium sp. sgz5001074]|uniref:hypothetical protein n=1 Tax=Gorillibacterium sp. sgz5001074 TaxID=3446695 RepID=UPI003F665B6C